MVCVYDVSQTRIIGKQGYVFKILVNLESESYCLNRYTCHFYFNILKFFYNNYPRYPHIKNLYKNMFLGW